jgi:hypothetical protein
LRENREHRLPDEDGFPNVDATPAAIPRAGMRAFKQSLGIYGTCIKEGPEFASRPRGTRRPARPKPQKAQMTMIKGLWR